MPIPDITAIISGEELRQVYDAACDRSSDAGQHTRGLEAVATRAVEKFMAFEYMSPAQIAKVVADAVAAAVQPKT